MDVIEVGAPGGKKVSRSLVRKAKQFFILLHSPCFFAYVP